MATLEYLKQQEYRVGNCQAIRYDQKNDLFGEGYLSYLYRKAKLSHRSKYSTDGILDTLFCGSLDTSHDVIVAYLSQRPVVVLGVWMNAERFIPYGLQFPTLAVQKPHGSQCKENSQFWGYGFFKEAWGTEELATLTLLGIAYIFEEYNVTTLLGSRYATNDLTSRLMRQFGFEDTGVIKNFLYRHEHLVDSVFSFLPRERFEAALAAEKGEQNDEGSAQPGQ